MRKKQESRWFVLTKKMAGESHRGARPSRKRIDRGDSIGDHALRLPPCPKLTPISLINDSLSKNFGREKRAWARHRLLPGWSFWDGVRFSPLPSGKNPGCASPSGRFAGKVYEGRRQLAKLERPVQLWLSAPIRPHRLRWLGYLVLSQENGDRRPVGLPKMLSCHRCRSGPSGGTPAP